MIRGDQRSGREAASFAAEAVVRMALNRTNASAQRRTERSGGRPAAIACQASFVVVPRVDVPVEQHRAQLLLLGIVEAAGVDELLRVLIGAEEHVPPDDVSVVVLVPVVLMVDPVHLGPLKEVTDPLRRPDVRVIEELADCGARGIHGTPFEGQAKERVDQCASDQRVHDHLTGMLVEGRDDFYPLGAVVDLVKQPPEEVDLMAPAVPPVEDERRDEVRNDAPDDGSDMRGKLEHRPRREPDFPGDAGCQDDAKLDQIDQDDPNWPRADGGQIPSGLHALKKEAVKGDAEDVPKQPIYLLRRTTVRFSGYSAMRRSPLYPAVRRLRVYLGTAHLRRP